MKWAKIVNVLRKSANKSGVVVNHLSVDSQPFSMDRQQGITVLQYYSITVLQKRLLQKK